MKCSLDISNFLEEISSHSHSISLYFFAMIAEEGFLISPCYSLDSAFKWALLCCWKRVFAMTSGFSWQNFISLCPDSFHTPRSNLPVTPGVSWLPTFAFQSPIMKRTSFEGVTSRRSCRSYSQLFFIYLDSILNTRDITLPTTVHLVKAMVFPVVMYGREIWTVKKTEHQRIDAF